MRQYDFAYDKRHSVRPKRNIRMAMQTEVAMYAACQKDERGLDKVVEDGKYRMKVCVYEWVTLSCILLSHTFPKHSRGSILFGLQRYGVTPNLLVRCYYFLNCSVQPNP